MKMNSCSAGTEALMVSPENTTVADFIVTLNFKGDDFR